MPDNVLCSIPDVFLFYSVLLIEIQMFCCFSNLQVSNRFLHCEFIQYSVLKDCLHLFWMFSDDLCNTKSTLCMAWCFPRISVDSSNFMLNSANYTGYRVQCFLFSFGCLFASTSQNETLTLSYRAFSPKRGTVKTPKVSCILWESPLIKVCTSYV